MGRLGTLRLLQSFAISDLMILLGNQLAARIVDKTGLMGRYDFHLEYSVDNSGRPVAALGPDDLSVGGGGPDIFTAFERQLGLKLEKAKESLDVLVIDHLEKTPSEN